MNNQEQESIHRDHFHMIFAEVIFKTQNRKDINGTRVKVFSKAKDLQFPCARLHHIQNSCAMQARSEVGNPQTFEVVDVNILNMFYLGQFTDEEFFAGIQKKVEETGQVSGENIVPLRPS